MNKKYAQNFQIYVEPIREIHNVLARFGPSSLHFVSERDFLPVNATFPLGLEFSFFLYFDSRSLALFMGFLYTITILL
jgi:hypothetical protein